MTIEYELPFDIDTKTVYGPADVGLMCTCLDIDLLYDLSLLDVTQTGKGMSFGKKVKKSLFIYYNLQLFGTDYPYRMWLVWRELNRYLGYAGAGTYDNFRLYIYRLKKLGLIKSVGEARIGFELEPKFRDKFRKYRRIYYRITPGIMNFIGWVNPFYALYNPEYRELRRRAVRIKGAEAELRRINERKYKEITDRITAYVTFDLLLVNPPVGEERYRLLTPEARLIVDTISFAYEIPEKRAEKRKWVSERLRALMIERSRRDEEYRKLWIG